MADFEPPSFSLGFDFDPESEPQPAVREDPSEQAGPSSSYTSFRTIEDDDDFEIPTTVQSPEVSDTPRVLKRLRRGSGSDWKPESSSAARGKPVEMKCNSDDEIEEFSSQENPCEVTKKRFDGVVPGLAQVVFSSEEEDRLVHLNQNTCLFGRSSYRLRVAAKQATI